MKLLHLVGLDVSFYVCGQGHVVVLRTGWKFLKLPVASELHPQHLGVGNTLRWDQMKVIIWLCNPVRGFQIRSAWNRIKTSHNACANRMISPHQTNRHNKILL
jgi:hypothetical protein